MFDDKTVSMSVENVAYGRNNRLGVEFCRKISKTHISSFEYHATKVSHEKNI